MTRRYCTFLLLSFLGASVALSQDTRVALAPPPAPVAFSPMAIDMFMRIEGVEGESQDAEHRGWIDILAYDHSLMNSIDLGSIGGGGSAGRATHEPIRVIKRIDKSSPLLFQALNQGTHLPEAIIEFVRTGISGPVPYLTVTLTEAYIVSQSMSGSAGDDTIMEELAIVYARIELSYVETKPDGSPGGTFTAGWDLRDNTNVSIQHESLRFQVEGPEVVIAWRTSSESGTYGFEIQHYEEGGFKRAAYVPASGWSSQPLEYEVRIRGLGDGNHVFRVAGLGVGGAVSYSEEFGVTIGDPGGFALQVGAPYPNPVSDHVTIGVSTNRFEPTRVSVWDLLGREIAVLHDGMLRPGTTERFVFEPSRSLPAGVYVVRATAGAVSADRVLTILR